MPELYDPCTGDQRRILIPTPREDVDKVVDQPSRWGGLSYDDRAIALYELAGEMQARRRALIVKESESTGKPLWQAGQECDAAIATIRAYAAAAATREAPVAGEWMAGLHSRVEMRPIGTVASILPWNYPLLLWAWQTGAALAAGCRVVTKPSEHTPDSAEIMQEICDDILPVGAHRTVYGAADIGMHLVRSEVDGIAFTGSARAGLQVSRMAGVRPTVMELGGNAPVIIAADAPAWTARAVTAALFYNAGQSCAAPARVIALPGTGHIVEEIIEIVAGSDAEDFGPLITSQAQARVRWMLSHTSGNVHLGRSPSEGWHHPAAVVVGASGAAVDEEVFGPVLTVQQASDMTEAIQWANGARQSLAASVWTNSLSVAHEVTRHLKAGEVWVNCHLEQTPYLPHTGMGGSGHGSHMSPAALHHWQTPVTITTRWEKPA